MSDAGKKDGKGKITSPSAEDVAEALAPGNDMHQLMRPQSMKY